MKPTARLGGIASILFLTAAAAAQVPGALPSEQLRPSLTASWAAFSPQNHAGWSFIGDLLDHREELGLSLAQVESRIAGALAERFDG